MNFMIGLTFGIDKNVINKNNNGFIKHRTTYSIHKIHKSRWSICKTKRHDNEFKMSITSTKSRFRNVFITYFELVITGTKIDFRKIRSSLQLIKKIINSRQR